MNRLVNLAWDDLEARLRPPEREADQWAKGMLVSELATLHTTLRELGRELPESTVRDFQRWAIRCSTWLFLLHSGGAIIECIPASGLISDARILYLVPLN
jgi:hypothetical protein